MENLAHEMDHGGLVAGFKLDTVNTDFGFLGFRVTF